jgi:hypothetical protein
MSRRLTSSQALPEKVRAVTDAVGALAAAVGVVVACVLVALLSGLVSRAAWRWSGHLVPWGLALAVAASAAAVVLARSLSRGMGFVAAASWAGGLLLLLSGRPEGDYLVASDWLGNAFLFLATGAVLVVAGWRSRAPR